MASESLKKTRQRRLKLIEAIEKKRNSKLIAYITSDRYGLNVQIAEDIISKLHKHLNYNGVKKNDNIDLFIYSRGGDADVPWVLVSMIREFIPEGSFNVIIPYKAHSAATVISLGADKIFMTKKGELGPIDATTMGPHNPYDNITKQKRPISVEDVNGYFNLIEKLNINDNKIDAFKSLTDKVDPLALGAVSRILEQTKLVARRLLETRKEKINKEDQDDIINKISSEIYSHRHAISRTEGRNYLGLKYIINTEDEGIDEEVWELFEEYSDFFDLDNPFMPEQYLLDKELDEHKWTGLKLACIESSSMMHLARKDMEIKRIKNVPNQVNLNLNNIALPNFNFPKTQESIKIEQIQQAIKQYFDFVVPKVLKEASENVAKEFNRSLPNKGFQKTDLNSKWLQIF